MRNTLSKMLSKFGYSLESTRFGTYGDWCVIGNGTINYFPTLGGVKRFVESLNKGG